MQPLTVAPYTIPPFVPITNSDIVSGQNAASGGTIITIPAGRTWTGVVTISVTAQVASGGSAVNAVGKCTIVGGSTTPAAGDIFVIEAAAPSSAASANGTAASVTASTPLTVRVDSSGGNSSLQVNGVNHQAIAGTAIGFLV